MSAYYLESSAVAKRYLSEVGSTWVMQVTQPAAANRLYMARVTPVEVASAITRKEREGTLAPADAQQAVRQLRGDVLAQYRVVAVDTLLAEDAIDLIRRHPLRAYDALQLAAAIRVHRRRVARSWPRLTFVCADTALNTAGAAEGLRVEDPNTHP